MTGSRRDQAQHGVLDPPTIGRVSTAKLARRGFTDPATAARSLADPALGDAGQRSVHRLLETLAAAADPDLALAALLRWAQAASGPLVAALVADAAWLTGSVAVLGASVALGDHVASHPADVLHTAPAATVGSAPEIEDADAETLRLSYRRFLLWLATRDLTGAAAMPEVGRLLGTAADAVLGAALRIAARTDPTAAAGCRLAIIGMGKCGGLELNYISDVDVVFVAEPPTAEPPTGESLTADGPAAERPPAQPPTAEPPRVTDGATAAASLRAATALATATMEICSAVAWPVDAGLRPEGRNGPLVRTLASHEAYYRRWARTWEFQALLRARPVAGDLALGAAYVDRLAPLVWTAADREHFVPDVQAMRRRVEQTLPRVLADREIKLGRGGLRDVEFAVQLLQLVHGRGDETLRSGTTLDALGALSSRGYVGRADAAALAAAYEFLRTAEHRLQLYRLRRTHLLPDSDADRRRLARSMGLPDADAFTAAHAAHARQVRRLHEKLFYRPLLSAVARVPTEALSLRPEAARVRLAALGFADPDGALRHLAALADGVSRRAAIQRTLLPAVLGILADAPDPDAGLLAYRRVSEALQESPWYLRLLRDEGVAAERLVTLLGSSPYVADLLGRAPAALRLLAEEPLRASPPDAVAGAMRSAVSRASDLPAAAGAVRALRRTELLRIAAADLLGQLSTAEVGSGLSDLAAATIGAVFRAAIEQDEYGEAVRVAVIGMGRLGGRELGYGSDADVLYLAEPTAGMTDAAAIAAATRVVNAASRALAAAAPDPSVELDAGLRPEGRNGPVVRTLTSYLAYYRRWAHPWEIQALLRARPAAGDLDLARRFVAEIDPLRYPERGLDAAASTEIRRIKARVDAERLPRGADPATHTKLGRGGLGDVEWTVQLLQLQYAGEHLGLRTASTLGALRAAIEAGVVDPDDAAALEAGWMIATRARNALTLVGARPRAAATDQLPRQGRALAAVARAVGYPPGRDPGEFLDDYLRATRRARRVVERLFYTGA